MKLCFDTSVAIDILGKTDWFFDSFVAYDIANEKRFDVCLSVSSTTDIVYVLHSRGVLSQKESRDSLGLVFELFDLMDNSPSDCAFAYKSDMVDYQDALIAYAAERHGVDFIITRDKKGFLRSPVPALSPKEFVRMYKPDYLEYERVDL